MHPLQIAVLALSMLSISKAYAGPGFPPPPLHGSYDDLLHYDRTPSDLWPIYRDGNRDHVNDDRMYWDDRLHDLGNPPPSGGGGNSVPFDGGISLLLAAGLGLGLKKAMRKNKSSREEGAAEEGAVEEGTAIG
jgi:hypothetical protein